MTLEKITLPAYSKGEELFNSISHGAGILFGIFSLIFLLLSSDSAADISGGLTFAISAIVLYSSSTLYHAITAVKPKKLLRIIDHSVIYILISGTIIAFNLTVFSPYNSVAAVASSLICAVMSVVGITLTIIDQEKYKKLQMVLYMVIGWSGLFLIYPFYKYCDSFLSVLVLVLAGGILYTVGTVFYAKGKKIRYFHGIFHLFVLAGTVLHFTAIYITIL